MSRTVVAPLERLRTMMMADARNKSIAGTVQKMWADGGVRGLFKVVPCMTILQKAFPLTRHKWTATLLDTWAACTLVPEAQRETVMYAEAACDVCLCGSCLPRSRSTFRF